MWRGREQIVYMSEGLLFYNVLIREFLVLYILYMFLEDVVTVSHHGQVNVQPFAAAGGKTASHLNYRPWPDQLLSLKRGMGGGGEGGGVQRKMKATQEGVQNSYMDY